MKNPNRIIGLLLAGGKATRMGGIDKGMAIWNGEPMAERVQRALKAVTPQFFISANRSLHDYESLAPGRVLADLEHLQGQGPLAGLLTGLITAKDQGAGAVLVCPCDTPGITSDIFKTLISAWEIQPDRPVIVENQGRTHPLHGVYPVSLIEELESWLATDNRRVMGFVKKVGAVMVDCPEAEAVFKNRNRPDDLTG
ncbi:molybdenum cofactor guanylyltransferase MobA [Marinobacter sp.]|uniref:molybdenum cofactor guanylyltransferase MobA n=1 Tax=Marinobacter sp. TaxID=50741 RepID=UPI002B273415|nr:molybdenum cofactor guanylyltransferase MobA [Marinobacter sp.]